MNDLDKEYGRQITFLQLDVSLPESKRAVRANDLKGHGALARDLTDRVIWTGPGHQLTRDNLLEGVNALLDVTSRQQAQ